MYKIFLVDDEYRIKERLMNLTDWKNTPFVFCGEASDGEMALSQINELKPDIVITDIQMPFMDGLELSKILKSTMPWIQIIIISGYDEFEYAKRALKIGVSDYLLKPIKIDALNSVLKTVINKIDKEKESSRKLLLMEERLKSTKALQKDFLFETLICGSFETQEIIEQFKEFEIDVISRHYVVIDVKISSSDITNYLEINLFCSTLLKKLSNALVYYKTPDRLIVVLRGNNEQELIDQAFFISGTIRAAVNSINNHYVIIGIGNTVNRLRDIAKSFTAAYRARSFINEMHIDQILFIEDVNKAISDIVLPSQISDFDKLSRLEKEEVNTYLEEILNDEQFDERMFRYHLIYNFVFQCNHIITKLGGKAKEVLPETTEKDIVMLVGCTKIEIKKMLSDVIGRTIEYRKEHSESRYSEIIWRAKNYIFDHYSDAGLSLNEISKHVCLSPNHFSMVFSNETKTTFIEFLTKTRIENAKKLLLHTDLKLSIITNYIGYNEPQYFSYIFKKHTGKTPSEYRETENL